MLTDIAIKKAKPDPTKNRLIADRDGLYLKVLKSGGKSFVHRYTYANKRPEVTLGTYPSMSLEQARDALRLSLAHLNAKVNPLVVKQEHQTALKAAPTVLEFVDEFKTDWLAHQYDKPDDAVAVIKRAIKGELEKKLLPDVAPEDITDTILGIVKRGRKVTANRSLTLLRKMFDHAILKRYRKDNPVSLQRKDAGGQEKPPRRQLQFEQVSEFMSVMENYKGLLPRISRLALLFELGTAKRGSEVVTMEWEHVNMATRIWDNPAHLTKEKHGDHRVFLNDFTLGILREIEQLQERELGRLAKYVFLSPQWRPGRPEMHMARHSLSHAILDLHKAGVLTYKFTPHTFRKTFSSRLADMGVMPHITEKCLDHLMVGVMAVYNLANYYPERQQAMNLWGAKLLELSKR